MFEVEFGVTTFRDLIYAPVYGGGIRGGRELKAFIPGGASAPWFYEEHLDLPLEKGTVDKAGSMLGSGAIVVMDETTDAVKACLPGRAVLRPRVVRQVHAVPRGHHLAGEDPRSASSTATAARATSTCCSTSATTSAPASPGRRSRPRSARSARRPSSPIASAVVRFRDEFEAYIGGPAEITVAGRRRAPTSRRAPTRAT